MTSLQSRLARFRKREPPWYRGTHLRGPIPAVLCALLLPFVCARPATLRVYVIGAEGPLVGVFASVHWHSNWQAPWTPNDSFGWEVSGSTNQNGYVDFRGLPPGVPFVASASARANPLRLEAMDARELEIALDVREVVDLRAGRQEIRMHIPSGSIRGELDVEGGTIFDRDANLRLAIGRVPDFLVDPAAPVTRLEKRWTDSLHYMWKHAPVHIWQVGEESWRGRSLLFSGAQTGTYRAWAFDSDRHLRWASEPFLVGEGRTDLGKIQPLPNHEIKIIVRGVLESDLDDSGYLTILAERVPEGNASDQSQVVDGGFEGTLGLIEGGHKLRLWYHSPDGSILIAESERFEVPETTEFVWQIPAAAFDAADE